MFRNSIQDRMILSTRYKIINTYYVSSAGEDWNMEIYFVYRPIGSL